MASSSTEQELNLVPYMDVVMTLILAMVVLTSTLVDQALAAAEVEAPPVGTGGSAPLNLGIGATGFELRQGGAAVTLPRESGGWPYAALTTALRGLRDAGEPSTTLTIDADPSIPVSVLVAAMDAARTDEKGALYPSVALGVAAR